MGGLARSERPWRAFATEVAHLVALASVAIVQPLLDVLGRNGEFFVERQAGRAEVLWFVAIAVLAVPLALGVLEAAVLLAAGRRLQTWLHVVFVALLGSLFGMAALKGALAGNTIAWCVAALVLGAALAALYRRAAPMRMFLSFLALAPVLFVGLFLAAPEMRDVIGSPDVPLYGDRVTIERPAPVVILVLDELPLSSLLRPDGAIDDHRFPGFAELARRTTWYRNASSVGELTTTGGTSMFTGRLPEHEQLVLAREHPRNLFTLLGGRYQIDGRPRIFAPLCPPDACAPASSPTVVADLVTDALGVYGFLAAPPAVRDVLPPVELLGDSARAEGSAQKRAVGGNEALRFGGPSRSIGAIEARHQDYLHFTHALIPHHSWFLLPNGKTYAAGGLPPGLSPDLIWTSDPAAVVSAYHRHLLQVGAADALVTELMRRLDDIGMWDEALVIVVADHGIRFQPSTNSRFLSTEATFKDIGQVPLMVKYPEQATGRVDARNVQTIDVLPTIIDVLGVDVAWQLDGRSLLDVCERGDVKQILNLRGKLLTFPFDPDAATTAARRKQVLGLPMPPANELQRFYAYGPFASIVGRDVRDFAIGAPTELDLSFVTPTSFDAARAENHVDALISGSTARDALPPHVAVALVVDDQIVTVPITFAVDDRTWLQAVVPRDVLGPRAIDVDLYVVEGPRDAPVLRPFEPR